MHQALKTPELVLEISSHLCSPRNLSVSNLRLTRKERASLLAVALTCHNFCDPALNLLWFFMSDLVLLFKVLPNFFCDKSLGLIKGRLANGDLERFKTYASRIRSFEAAESVYDLSPALLRIQYAIGQTGLLPRLHRLFFNYIMPHENFLCLLHSGLLELCFDPPPGSDFSETAVFFQFLLEKCPQIRRLELKTESPDEMSLASIYGMKNLGVLQLAGDIDPDGPFEIVPHFLSLLSSTPTLSHITLGLHSPFYFTSSDIHFSPVNLPSLVRLEVFGDLDSLLSMDGHVLGSSSLPNLQSLEMHLFVDNATLSTARRKWAKFCASLFLIAPNIKNLTIKSTSPIDFSFSSFASAIPPHLRSLTINSNLFKIQRQDLSQLLRSAPSLYSLGYLSHDNEYKDLLVDIASTMIDLTELRVSKCALKTLPFKNLPISNNKLAKLIVLGPMLFPPIDPINSAFCVQRLFPNLTSVFLPDFAHYGSRQCQWQKMKDTLQSLWHLRDDERMRLQSDGDTCSHCRAS